ncbi:MAG: ATP-binding protein [Proteobacteria bacterium]|nr:ATP-binding protein [Pseudomonadota bacterium]
MSELVIAPYAPALIESLRSAGYSLESAIADVMDNSISAGAKQIHVRYSPHDDPYILIFDDGIGMTPSELTEAMRHGNRDPGEVRAVNDLGRFGLGLKTASLSQCRKLTVISLKGGQLSARCWDIDLIAARDDWVLYVPEGDEIEQLPFVKSLKAQGHGTIVLWQKLDRVAVGERNIQDALSGKMDIARLHLALVFHKYLSGETNQNKIEIRMNENYVSAFDPFFSKHSATQVLQEELIMVENHNVLIKAYILPHISKLSPDELRTAGGEEGLRHNQGFYVYRNHRLITWGTWFRLTKRAELSKLARVSVNIPNALDHLWTLDIKKSTAYPPEEVRRNLSRIINKIVGTSHRVYTYRGRITKTDNLIHSWNRFEGRDGISYVINREHPIMKAFRAGLDVDNRKMLDLFLDTIESTFPADALYADMASDRPRKFTEIGLKERLTELALFLLETAEAVEGGKTSLLEGLAFIDPFCQYPIITESILKELSNAYRE